LVLRVGWGSTPFGSKAEGKWDRKKRKTARNASGGKLAESKRRRHLSSKKHLGQPESTQVKTKKRPKIWAEETTGMGKKGKSRTKLASEGKRAGVPQLQEGRG